jgi:hypothetical protein
LRRRIDGGPVYHRSDEKMVAEAAFVAFLLFVFLVPFERQRSDGAAASAAKFPISVDPSSHPARGAPHPPHRKEADRCHGRRRDGGRGDGRLPWTPAGRRTASCERHK